MKNWQHDPFDWAPERKPGGGWLCFKSSPSPPPAPDYTGAATATAAGNKEAAIASQRGSMVNQYTPYGSLNYSDNGNDQFGNPTYNATYNLSGVGQQLLNQQNSLSTGLFGSQNTALNQVAGRGPIDNRNVANTTTAGQGADIAYNAAKSRLDPQWQASSSAKETQLANQGLQPGTEAYTNAMRDFNYAKNDAYSQAQGQSQQIGMSQAATNNAAAAQQLQMNQAMYEQPLNELNALRTGSQVTNPQFSPQPQQQQTAGPNYLGAAQAQGQYDQGLYNSQVGSQNSAMSGLMTVGGAIGSAFI